MTPRAIEPDKFDWLDYRRYTFSLGLSAGGAVFLSGHSASCYDPAEGRVVVRGGVAEQCRVAYEKVGALLEAAGLGPASVVRVVEYVPASALAGYPEIEAARVRALPGARPAVSTVVVHRLLRRDALVEIEVTASAEAPVPAGEDGEDSGAADAAVGPNDNGPVSQPVPGSDWGPASAAGGLVYLSSMFGADRRGRIVGGVAAQAEQIYDNAARALAAAGTDLSRSVKTLDYISPRAVADYKETGKVRRDRLGPVFPAAAGIISDRVARDGALLQVDLIAARRPVSAVDPGWDRYERLTYSPAVRAGSTLFLSGLAALDQGTRRAVHAGDIAAQAAHVYESIAEVLRAAGGGPENLVRTVEYVTMAGLARYRETAAVRAARLANPLPASTGVVCAGLLRPEFEIEVDATAVLP